MAKGLLYGDGTLHEGGWKNGQQHGQGIEYNIKGKAKYDGFWQNGIYTIKKNQRVEKTYKRSTNN